MNPLVIAIVTSALAAFVVACGLKLIDIGSNLARPIVKYGPVAACLIGVIAVFNFQLIDALDLISMEYALIVGGLSLVAFGLIYFIFDILRRCLLIPKRAKSRKQGRVSKLSVACIFCLDLASGIMAGAVAGVSFALNTGTGITVVCALMLLMLDRKIQLIKRYQTAKLNRGENIAALGLTLVAFPVATGVICYISRSAYSAMGAFLAVALGYLLCLSAIKAVEIVKTLRKS